MAETGAHLADGILSEESFSLVGGLGDMVVSTGSACLLTSLPLTSSCDRQAGWPRQNCEAAGREPRCSEPVFAGPGPSSLV